MITTLLIIGLFNLLISIWNLLSDKKKKEAIQFEEEIAAKVMPVKSKVLEWHPPEEAEKKAQFSILRSLGLKK